VTAARGWQEADRSLAAESGYSCDLNDSFRAEVSASGGAVAEVEASYARAGHVNNVVLEAECEGGHVAVDLERARGVVRTTRFEPRPGGAPASDSAHPAAGAATPEMYPRGAPATAATALPRDHHFTKVFSTYAEFVRLLRGDESLPHWIPPASMADGVAVQRMIEAAERRAAPSA
jgi:predicted dehydrogenase